MKTVWSDKPLKYDGSQLRSLYGYLEHGALGDSIVAFEGPCDVSFEHMLDGEDLLARSLIAGDCMVHFIVEKFHVSLIAGVALHRLLASLCLELLRERAGHAIDRSLLRRDGDDVFFGERKFSVSVATATPVSVLIHFAVNSVNSGTPVPTCSLEDFTLAPASFAAELSARFAAEISSIEEACCKVRWAR